MLGFCDAKGPIKMEEGGLISEEITSMWDGSQHRLIQFALLAQHSRFLPKSLSNLLDVSHAI